MSNTFTMKKILFLLCLFAISIGYSQEKIPAKFTKTATLLRVSAPLSSYAKQKDTIVDASTVAKIRNNMRNAPKTNPDALPLHGDPVVQTKNPVRAPQDVLLSFDGIDVNEGQAVPPDPTGAAGPNHYVHAVNRVIKIYDDEGLLLDGPILLGDFFENGISDGDPIVMYDQLANRWFISEFYDADDALLIAISTTGNPLGNYNIYQFDLSSFPDYPHYAVWPDGYYLTANKNGDVGYVLDRVAMLNGDNNPEVVGFTLPGLIRNPNTVFGAQAANLLGDDLPPPETPGYFVYLQDDAWTGVIFDHLKIWQVDPNFDNGAIGTISLPQVIPTADFDSTFQPFGDGDTGQPGTPQNIDNLGGVISYMTNFRTFDTHNSLILNFNVNLGSDRSGIRWYELRNETDDEFTIFQEGTWSRPDNLSRFLGSICMNKFGDIALSYNTGNFQNLIDIRFTGRLVDDPLNEMSFQETLVADSSGPQTFSNRFGDYSQMTIDPDDETFWFTTEYFKETDVWSTRITHFSLDGLPVLANETPESENAVIAVFPYDTATHRIVLETARALNELTFDVLDIKGKKVTSGNLINDNQAYMASFNTTNLTTGVYLLQIKNNSGFNELKKFIIN